MTEHIILLSDTEVRGGATLIVRPFPKAIMHYPNGPYDIADAVYPARESGYIAWYGKDYPDLAEFTKQQYKEGFANPLGVPGDVLLGKEAYALPKAIDEHLAEDGCTPDCLDMRDVCGQVFYRATDADMTWEPIGKWRPSSTMPRWAIRWRRTVVEAGVMRVGEIEYDDYIAAGFKQRWTCLHPGIGSYAHANDVMDDFRAEFNRRWGKRVRFEDNPWCFWARVGEEV